LNNMAQHNLTALADRSKTVLSFARPSIPDSGETALNLVYQAAKVFRSIEDQAQETEARAQALCKSALERLKLAEMRTEAAERARRELITEAECKLQDASRAQGQSPIEAAEDRLTAVEFMRKQPKLKHVRPRKRSRSLRKPSVGVSFVQVPMLWAGSLLSPDDLTISFGR
jgi:hypothetical protein